MLDADVYGFSIPRMLGVTGRPTRIGEMILPPVAHGVKVISVGMFVDGNVPVVWRGPMLHRALQQFLADVFWGDLDVLLLDLPPGTGDIAISTAQLIPTAEILVVTTPQTAAAEVAERAGAIVTADPAADRRGGGEHVGDDAAGRHRCWNCSAPAAAATVAASLSRVTGTTVPLLGQIPLQVELRTAGDAGVPLVRWPRVRRRPRQCVAWPTTLPPGAGRWPACRWGSPRPAADALSGWYRTAQVASLSNEALAR